MTQSKIIFKGVLRTYSQGIKKGGGNEGQLLSNVVCHINNTNLTTCTFEYANCWATLVYEKTYLKRETVFNGLEFLGFSF